MTGRKDDQGKSRLDLLPWRAVLAVGRVLEFGARKYSPDNWRKVPDLKRRYFAAALRHLGAYGMGVELDEDSGEHHLAHAACCIMFILTIEEEELDTPAPPDAQLPLPEVT